MGENFREAFLKSSSVVASEPGKVVVGYGERQSHSTPPENKLAFYFPDYFLHSKKPWITYSSTEELTIEELAEVVKPLDNVAPLKWENRSEKIFRDAFFDLKRRLAAGELRKAVPFAVDTAQVSMSTERLLTSLNQLLKCAISHPIFIYGTWDLGEGILGGTPEKLFTLEANRLSTVAIAGTGKPGEHIEDDPKEQEEHNLVVQGITESIGSFGKLSVGKTTVLELRTLCHLMTPIELQLDEQKDWTSLVQALHPTPALGAFPKREGWAWLTQYETKLPRGRFGAPAGFFDGVNHTGKCYVSIRNIQWNTSAIQLFAGCGVVSASQVEREWNEIQLKMQSIREILSL